MHNLVEWFRFSSIATTSASAFYLFILLTIFFPSIRKRSWQLLSSPAPSTKIHISALDTIRGAAASLVVLAHIWNFCSPIFDKTQLEWWRFLCTGGNKAVPVFVILSGFLILRTVKRINSIDDLRLYIQRRFYRIYPVYLFTVSLGFLVGQMSFSLPNFLSNIFMIRSIYPHALIFVNPPAWSLFVEVLFYIALPIWVAAFRNRVILAAAASFLVLLFVDPMGGRELWIWKYFFIGIITSELCDYLKNRLSEPLSIVLFLIGTTLLILDFKITRRGVIHYDWFNKLKIVPRNPEQYTVGLAEATMFVLIGIIHSKWISRILGIKPLRVLGAVSYSLFLIHPFFILAVFPRLLFPNVGTKQHLIDSIVYAPAWYLPFIMFPGCLLWGMICFVLIERPFLLKSNKMTLGKPILPLTGEPLIQSK